MKKILIEAFTLLFFFCLLSAFVLYKSNEHSSSKEISITSTFLPSDSSQIYSLKLIHNLWCDKFPLEKNITSEFVEQLNNQILKEYYFSENSVLRTTDSLIYLYITDSLNFLETQKNIEPTSNTELKSSEFKTHEVDNDLYPMKVNPLFVVYLYRKKVNNKISLFSNELINHLENRIISENKSSTLIEQQETNLLIEDYLNYRNYIMMVSSKTIVLDSEKRKKIIEISLEQKIQNYRNQIILNSK